MSPCSRRRVNKAAVKRHGMSRRSFIRSFHLFVRSFIYSFILLYFVRSFRFFICFVRSYRSIVHFVHNVVRSCRLFVHAFRFRLFALASFAYSFTFQSFRGRFLFSSLLSELFILSLEHLSLSSSDSEFSTSERQSEESFATCKVYLRNYTSLNCFANPSK